MMRAAAITAVLGCTLPTLGAIPQEQRPVFRSATDAVTVDVRVAEGRRPVLDLAATDFLVDDNGARQRVELEKVESVPLDVSLVIDVSGSVARSLDDFRRDVVDVVALLRPIDRVRLVTFGDDVREDSAMQPTTAQMPVGQIKVRGGTSLNDGVFYGLAWPANPERRHLVVVLTDGADTSSALDHESLPLLARRSDATVYAVFTGTAPPSTSPGLGASRSALQRAAVETGGLTFSERNLTQGFRQILDDFRTSYILRYTRQGAETEGWHALTVSIARPGSFTVRARRGYFVTAGSSRSSNH